MKKRRIMSLFLALVLLVTPIFPVYADGNATNSTQEKEVNAVPIEANRSIYEGGDGPGSGSNPGTTGVPISITGLSTQPVTTPPVTSVPVTTAPSTIVPVSTTAAPVITGTVTPEFKHWEYDYAKKEYVAYFDYVNDVMVDGVSKDQDIALGEMNQIKETSQKRFENLLPTHFTYNAGTETTPFAIGKEKVTGEKYEKWYGAQAITWMVNDKKAVAKLDKGIAFNKTPLTKAFINGDAIVIENGKKTVVIEQGSSVSFTLTADGPNPNAQLAYKLEAPMAAMIANPVSTEPPTVVQEADKLTFKGYDVGEVVLAAEVTNNLPETPKNMSLSTWEMQWPSKEATRDTVMIKVVPKKDISIEKGLVLNLDGNSKSEVTISLKNSYQKLVALTQVMNPLFRPMPAGKQGLVKAAKVPPMIVGSMRNDIMLKNSKLFGPGHHEYMLATDSFKTSYENSLGLQAVRPYGYFAGDAGLLKDANGRVIGILDTQVIDNNDNEGSDEKQPVEPEVHRIYFNQSFDQVPVVIAQLASFEDKDYAHARIVNVTMTYFDVIIEEWGHSESANYHGHEYLSYVAVIPGAHSLADGDILEAGLSSEVRTTFTTIFDTTPVLMSQTQTTNSTQGVVTENVPVGVVSGAPYVAGATLEDDVLGFNRSLMSENGNHPSETLGYVAMGQKYKPVPATIELNPTQAKSFDVPYEYAEDVTQQYTAVIYDQHHVAMTDLQAVISAKKPKEDGATKYSLTDGLLRINRHTSGGKVLLSATYNGLVSNEIEVTINREAPRETRISLVNKASTADVIVSDYAVPYVDQARVEAKFVAKVIDQYGYDFDNPGEALLLQTATKPKNTGFKLGDPGKVQRIATFSLTHKSLGGAYTVVASYKGLKDATLSGVVTRELPKVYKLDLALGAVGDDTINVPYYQLPNVTKAYKVSATDQYGEAINADAVLEGTAIPPEVQLDQLNISVSYDDDAGMMTVWAVLSDMAKSALATLDDPKTESLWHKSVTADRQKSNGLNIKIAKEELRAARIVFESDNALDNRTILKVPYENHVENGHYRVSVYDQYGDLLDVPATIAVKSDSALPQNVQFINNTLALTPVSKGGLVVLEASCANGTKAALTVEILKETPRPARIALSGKTKLIVPQNDVAEKGTYQAAVYDQYGQPIVRPVKLTAKSVDGTTFDPKKGTLEVTYKAPHSYVVISAELADLDGPSPVKPINPLGAPGAVPVPVTVKAQLIVFLVKSVQIDKDDANNTIIGIDDNMEYAFEENATEWYSLSKDQVAYFPGDKTIFVRYGTKWPVIKVVDLLNGFEPGPKTKLTFTVLAPVLDGPERFVNSAVVSVQTKENPRNVEDHHSTKSYFSLDNGKTWTVYTQPFTLTQTTRVLAKTLVEGAAFGRDSVDAIDPMVMPEPLIYTSKVVERLYTRYTPQPVEEAPADTNNNTTITIVPPVVPQGDLTLKDPAVPKGALKLLAYAQGYADGTFKPKQAITRGEFGAMLARIMNLDVVDTKTGFGDVPSTLWYAGHIKALKVAGVVKGDAKGNFRPDAPLTKAELATMMSNYWAVVKKDVATTPAPYTDTKGHWAQVSINKLYNSGLMEGFTDTAFRPNTSTSREQIIVMLNRETQRPLFTEKTATYKDVAADYWSFGNIESAARDMMN